MSEADETTVTGRRALIVGKGTAGRALADDVRGRGGVVVGFLDDTLVADDVLGTLADASRVVAEQGVQVIYFAIPSVDAKTVREFMTSIDADDVEIAIIPRTYSILARETVRIDDLTDVDVLDLVGREPVKHDVLVAREFIAGKVVVVTGAAGSIGSRLLRQVLDLDPKLVIGVDWWENGMFFLGEELKAYDRLRLHIGDVRSERAMAVILEQYRPDVLFHAAAFKHVPLMQANPLEAVSNNVGGTLTVMRQAIAAEVANVVYVSTDKAVNPVNVMGATKRIGEMLMECLAEGSATRFNAVRFGNVIQSNGSVMQIFRNQIANKKPLTVTDPEVTRFFMTVDEASQLVIHSAFVGEAGDLFVLDMGEPVRIMDLAQSLVRAIDPRLQIEVTGLRPGEKMFEELSYDADRVQATSNPKIFVVRDAIEFDRAAFMDTIEALLARVRRYEITGVEVIEELRSMGFAIK